MTKHSKRERAQRTAEDERLREVQAAWIGSLPPDRARAFEADVAAARSRPLPEPRADMAPGTAPRPPRPGHEPRPPKDEQRSRRRH